MGIWSSEATQTLGTVPGLEIERFWRQVPYKAPQTESLSLGTLKFCQYQHKTHTDKRIKTQGAATLRGDATLIFILVNFCCPPS
jgi:hypothetical protein